MPYLEAFSNALLKVSHTRSGHTSVRPLYVPLCIHGGKQEVTKPLFFLPSCAAEEVKSGGKIIDVFGRAFLWTCRFSSWLLSPTILRPSRLIPLGVCSLCQLDADGILWVPYPLSSQHRWQQEYL